MNDQEKQSDRLRRYRITRGEKGETFRRMVAAVLAVTLITSLAPTALVAAKVTPPPGGSTDNEGNPRVSNEPFEWEGYSACQGENIDPDCKEQLIDTIKLTYSGTHKNGRTYKGAIVIERTDDGSIDWSGSRDSTVHANYQGLKINVEGVYFGALAGSALGAWIAGSDISAALDDEVDRQKDEAKAVADWEKGIISASLNWLTVVILNGGIPLPPRSSTRTEQEAERRRTEAAKYTDLALGLDEIVELSQLLEQIGSWAKDPEVADQRTADARALVDASRTVAEELRAEAANMLSTGRAKPLSEMWDSISVCAELLKRVRTWYDGAIGEILSAYYNIHESCLRPTAALRSGRPRNASLTAAVHQAMLLANDCVCRNELKVTYRTEYRYVTGVTVDQIAPGVGVLDVGGKLTLKGDSTDYTISEVHSHKGKKYAEQRLVTIEDAGSDRDGLPIISLFRVTDALAAEDPGSQPLAATQRSSFGTDLMDSSTTGLLGALAPGGLSAQSVQSVQSQESFVAPTVVEANDLRTRVCANPDALDRRCNRALRYRPPLAAQSSQDTQASAIGGSVEGLEEVRLVRKGLAETGVPVHKDDLGSYGVSLPSDIGPLLEHNGQPGYVHLKATEDGGFKIAYEPVWRWMPVSAVDTGIEDVTTWYNTFTLRYEVVVAVSEMVCTPLV